MYFTAGDAGALRHARHSRQFVVATPRARDVLEAAGVRIDALVFSESDHDEATWAKHVASHTRLLVATEGGHGGRWWGESEGRWDSAPLPGRAARLLRLRGFVRGRVHARAWVAATRSPMPPRSARRPARSP